ncbi:uncharacterized protein LDX57_005957 [Aspergillus melleus]|uniref:uncharacterized protein n=1 Tax=Aspergillus melleus TaxID=138277 RepID=UPI001E8E98EC|nr:uncharacterized protein LDX57_005957 [Aspergillus melleus]KAH8428254.1 hypothetical protein LDX57_005957 [Aspergillus melleus]
MLKPTRAFWSVQQIGLQPSSRGLSLTQPPPLSAYRKRDDLPTVNHSKISPDCSFYLYKSDTETVAAWLAKTAKAYGYQFGPSTANASSTNNNEELPPASGTASPVKHQLALHEFTKLADFIAAASDPPVSVPRSFMKALTRAIFIRKNHSWQIIPTIPEGPEKLITTTQHRHFINVLKYVRKVLRPKVSSRRVRDPLVRSTSAAATPEVPKPRQDLKKAYLGFELLMKDFRSLRTVIIRSWLGYQDGTFDLIAVSLVTNSAINVARRMQEDVQKLFDKYGGSSQILNAIYVAQCAIDGEDPNFRERPGDDLNFRVYDTAESMMLPTFMLLQSFNALVESGNVLSCKPGYYGTFDPASVRSEKSVRGKYQEDKIVMLEALSGFLTFHRGVSPQPFEDQFTRGLRLMFKTHDVPIWLVFAAQVFLDIHHALRGNVRKAFSDLKTSVRSMGAIKENLELQSSLTIEGWLKKDDREYHSILQDIYRWVDSDPVKELKARPGERFKFMKWNPLFCGMLNYNLQCCMGINYVSGPPAQRRLQRWTHLPWTPGRLVIELILGWHSEIFVAEASS